MSATTPDVRADPELETAAWNLEDLVEGEGQVGVERLLGEARELGHAFAERYVGHVAELDSGGLAEAMHALERIEDRVGRAGSYAGLWFTTDTADPARGALMQKAQEIATQIETELLFFELEWAALEDDQAEALLADPALEFCAHHLRTVRRYRPHLLTEPEERIMSEKGLTGRGAWTRLFEELTAALEVELPPAGAAAAANGESGGDGVESGGDGVESGGDGVESGGDGPPGDSPRGEGVETDGTPARVALDVALSRLMHPDRDVRRTAAEAVTEALSPGLRTRAYVFNTLLQDKAVDDRLRHYSSWLASRNLANEASDESVQALLDAVRARFELPRRWYRLKARLLGIDKLADYDRVAAVSSDQLSFRYREAREIVLECYGSFSPELGRIAGRFFEDSWIDAPVRPNKRGGAFCSYTVPSVHPYVMLNYTAQRRDVLTLAHELGHGVHAALAADQGIFHQGMPLTMAETASVMGETIVFGSLLERDSDPESRLSLIAENLEGAIATVFRQVAMLGFEDSAHGARREEGELSVQRLGDLWQASQAELLGDAVEITPGYRSWWSYIPHFINTPGYVYAYAFGQLLALSVYQRYLDEGDELVPRYVEMLRAGGSRSPEELGAIVGVDLADPGFWDRGLELVEQRLTDAEAAARATGRLG